MHRSCLGLLHSCLPKAGTCGKPVRRSPLRTTGSPHIHSSSIPPRPTMFLSASISSVMQYRIFVRASMPSEKLPYEEILVRMVELDNLQKATAHLPVWPILVKPSTVSRSQDDESPNQETRLKKESPLGPLEKLPNEIIRTILNMLDIVSLVRFSQICWRAHLLVQQLPAFVELVKYKPDAITALFRADLLHQLSAGSLRKALWSKECVSCFRFGVYLNLATAERVCYGCATNNVALHMISVGTAQECFKLQKKDLKKLKVAFFDKDHPMIKFCVPNSFPLRLVNVRQAKLVAIEVHGSMENLPPYTEREKKQREEKTPTGRRWLQAYMDAPLKPSRDNIDLKAGAASSMLHEIVTDAPLVALGDNAEFMGLMNLPIPPNNFFPAAYMRFPYLSDNGADSGRQCGGCVRIANSADRVPQDVIEKLVGPNLSENEMYDKLVELSKRYFTKPGFEEHAKHCPGVKEIVDDYNEWFDKYTQGKSENEFRDTQYLYMHRCYDAEKAGKEIPIS